MHHISILDCTLRDGGYVNNFQFGHSVIKNIILKLVESGLEIIECGFLVSGADDKEKTLFSNIEKIGDYIGVKKQYVMYVAMIQYGAITAEEITPYNENSIDGIRLTFHEHEIEGAFLLGKCLMEKGYKIFMQPVGTNTYTDQSLLSLIEKINVMHPFAFYLVDTLGSMYKKDILRMFYLVDHNLDENIAIGFHSHNNLQISFSNAQELILLNSTREIILDTSVFGMGRGAGNLCTELLMQYINENITYKYEIIPIVEIIDRYIYPIYAKQYWGYSVPYYIAAVNNCHPNYASYLIGKQTISIKDIESILRSMDMNKRTLYDEKYITELYLLYQKHTIDDRDSLDIIKAVCNNKEILILAPGKSLIRENDLITSYIKQKTPIVISINHIPDMIAVDFVFVSNLRRFNSFNELYNIKNVKFICTSNITTKKDNHFILINYTDYLNADSLIADNAGLMLLNLFTKINIKKVVLGGFDGFSLDKQNNYFDDKMITNVDNEKLLAMNKSIVRYLHKLNKFMPIDFLTKSIYQEK